MRRFALLALVTLGSACATAQATTAVVHEPLDVPPVPPRIIVPEIAEEPPPPEPVARPAPAPLPPPPSTPRPAERAAEPVRAGAPEAPPRSEEAPRVRTPQTANEEQAERDVRAVMGRAQGLLQHVDYQALSGAARQQYDTARRFLTQADRSLRIRNYVFARNLADKAETLARQLGK